MTVKALGHVVSASVAMVLFCLLPAARLRGHQEWVVFNTHNSHLPGDKVFGIAFDWRGRTWLATWDQVACFDGQHWTVWGRTDLGVPTLVYTWGVCCDDTGGVWVTTNSGLLQFNGNQWALHTPLNSGLPDWWVECTVCQPGGQLAGPTLWIGTMYKGLVRFSKGSWKHYYTGNSEMPGDQVVSLHLRPNGELWMGVFNHGVVRLWGREQFTTYDWHNSLFPSHVAWDFASDAHGNLWMATANGLVKFKDEQWQVFTIYNSDIPDHVTRLVEVEGEAVLWIGTSLSGLMRYDGQRWTVYDTTNSPLPSNHILSLAIDRWGNKWIGTWSKGLAIFREGGVILGVDGQEPSSAPQQLGLAQNYPNPFNTSTRIQFSLDQTAEVELNVYDLQGRAVARLLSGMRPAGSYGVSWDGRDQKGQALPSGIYTCQLRVGDQLARMKMALVR